MFLQACCSASPLTRKDVRGESVKEAQKERKQICITLFAFQKQVQHQRRKGSQLNTSKCRACEGGVGFPFDVNATLSAAFFLMMLLMRQPRLCNEVMSQSLGNSVSAAGHPPVPFFAAFLSLSLMLSVVASRDKCCQLFTDTHTALIRYEGAFGSCCAATAAVTAALPIGRMRLLTGECDVTQVVLPRQVFVCLPVFAMKEQC